jgi:hypothetical protein
MRLPLSSTIESAAFEHRHCPGGPAGILAYPKQGGWDGVSHGHWTVKQKVLCWVIQVFKELLKLTPATMRTMMIITIITFTTIPVTLNTIYID